MARKTSASTSKALYRKYRPTKLNDVVGQDQVTAPLQNAIKQSKIGHAYLFIGPRGTGKTSVARIFAHAVNGFSYELEDSYLDIVEIDAASNTGVDNIRELREKAIIAPTKGKYKVYIIDEVHMLSKSAANALLKTVEEPPEHVIFIMATTEANKVPITISSRTQVYTFHLASPDIMLAHLQTIAIQEKIDITDDALRILVARGGGSFRDTLSILDQVKTLTDQKITAELLTAALGLPQDQVMTELLSAYTCGNLENIHHGLEALINSGFSAENIASELVQKIVSQPSAELLPLLSGLTSVKQPFPEAKLLLALTNITQTTALTSRLQTITAPTHAEHAPRTPELQPVSPTPEPTATTPSEPTQPKTKPAVSKATPEVASPQNGPKPKPKTPAAAEPDNFSWDSFLEAVHADNDAVFLQLEKTDHEFIDGTLHIYPPQKFIAKVLNKPDNSQLLAKHLNGIALTIHEAGEYQPPKDERISQISAIMGNVQEIKGDLPF